jgi:hypothetical protein
MKTHRILACALFAGTAAWADTTVDPAAPYAYAANAGWVNAYADGTNGAVIGQAYCSGFLYSANLGWISLGNGAPANGYAYSNADGADAGVNHDGAGRLRGLAWSANAGWISFESIGDPRVDLASGDLSGYAWGANLGWIRLDGVRTAVLRAGADSDGDGIPDPWEYQKTGGLAALAGGSHDADNDGVSDADEYGADTGPLDNQSFLAFTALSRSGTVSRLTWTVAPTRFYELWRAPGLDGASEWTPSALGVMPPDAGAEMTREVDTASPVGPTPPAQFYRVKAVLPLGE